MKHPSQPSRGITGQRSDGPKLLQVSSRSSSGMRELFSSTHGIEDSDSLRPPSIDEGYLRLRASLNCFSSVTRCSKQKAIAYKFTYVTEPPSRSSILTGSKGHV